jgi:DNA-binding response OmpR family regulator
MPPWELTGCYIRSGTTIAIEQRGFDEVHGLTMAARTYNPVVMVVEDDPAVRELLADVLDEIDYEVIVASDGNVALQVMQSLKVDLITLDLDLPGLTGGELLRIIHERDPQAPPIIIVTSEAPVSRALQAKVQSVVNKPFNVDDLIATIVTLLSRERAKEASRTVRADHG